MTYEEFMAHIPQKCMYETIYEDSEGVPILVIRLLDAYVMVNRLVKAEREACAKVCEDSNSWDLYDPNGFAANLIRTKGQA